MLKISEIRGKYLENRYLPQFCKHLKLAINQIFSKTITVETMVGQYDLFHFSTLFFINYAITM